MSTNSYGHAWTHREARESYESRPTPPQGAPNVLVILLDDTGFAELGCYGSEIETPNIDRLAREGLQFTNFHTTSLCSSSRACLLTGRNHHAVGMRMLANVDSGRESGRGRIHPSCGTLAEMLRPIGYNTMAVGKWHLALMEETGPIGPYDDWPLGKGFERFYGFMEGATDHFYPELTHDNHRIDPPRTPEEGYHLTEDLVDQAIHFMSDQLSHGPDKPFFLYFCLGATHAPHQAPDEYLQAYRGKYDEGYDVVREQRFARQKERGIVPPETELPPSNLDVPAWSELNESERLVAARLQEAYAGFLTHTDHQIGRLLDFLDQADLADDTIVMVLSDNGAAMEGGPVGAVSRIRFFNGLPEDSQFNLDKIGTIGGPNGDNHYPRGWAQAGNTPGRWYKYHSHEGGVHDPLIVRWPSRITARGEIRNQFHHIIDIAPTILELIGIDSPRILRGVEQRPIHGVSMSYCFDDSQVKSNRKVQYFEMFGNRAIYADGWKAVSRHFQDAEYDEEPWELYHLESDFSEAHDLAEKHPKKLEELVRLWHVEAGKYDVLPLDDRSVELFSRPLMTHSPYARNKFVYYPSTSHIQNKATPNTTDRSYRIDAELHRTCNQDGVIVVYGNLWSGYGFYIANNHAVFEYNFCGDISRVISRKPVPNGEVSVSFKFRRTGHLQGDGTLEIDGLEEGKVQIPRTLTFNSMTGMDIGRNAHAPFSSFVKPPASLEGVLTRVTFTLDDAGD